ncbi:MAG: hypothetical protein GTN62_11230, partial [Gemmatimonadales bacterium]|nr:hypothetical protein [Gemmatimonadales bacterium]NIN50667.1 hypothetical protein [Gemmatimonadales bacterium]NIP08131.1 hypothetical protein [Gemmatimonadales bacterium]NIS67093.1 hypothetical protein [Gemmatimonadales bacterium]
LTDHLIHELAQTEALTVLSRKAVERYRYANVPLDSIVREHAVGAIVEGSITGRADGVRITAQLIDGATLKHLGSQVVLASHKDPEALVIMA